MSASICAILAALVPLVVWFIRRRAARRDDPANHAEQHHEQIERESFITTKLAPIALSMMTCAGCAHYKVISSDRIIRRIKADEPFHAPSDGWFVPDARWLEIRDALAERIDKLESQSTNPKP